MPKAYFLVVLKKNICCGPKQATLLAMPFVLEQLFAANHKICAFKGKLESTTVSLTASQYLQTLLMKPK